MLRPEEDSGVLLCHVPSYSHLLVSELELARAPESYRDTVRAKLTYDVKWLPRGWAVGDHPNRSNLSLSM